MPSQRAESGQATTLLEVTIAAARRAAAFIRERSADLGALDVREKRPADFVSEVDEGAETRIREVLLEAVPDAVVLGEELSPRAATDAETVFIVDPLDGTTNFLHGFEAYSVSIGTVLDGRMAAAVVLDIPRDELYTATAGGGAWRDNTRMSVSSVGNPGRALIATGFPFKNLDFLEDYLQQFARVTRAQAGIRRAGSAALDLAWVAAGRFDAFWEQRLAPWDMAAGMLLVREAGGRVTDFEGTDLVPGHTAIVASNDVLHDWLLQAIRIPAGQHASPE